MYRSLLVLLVAAPMPVFAAPPPKGAEKNTYYFPTKAGAKRVYEVTTEDGTVQSTETITKVEEKDGMFRVTVERDGDEDRAATADVYAVSSKGVSVVTRRGRDLQASQHLLKLPAKPGDTWDFDPTPANPAAGALPLGYTYTTGKEVEIETPAGKFTAIPVEAKRSGGGSAFGGTSWFAPGVGLVKSVDTVGDIKRTIVLKSFTPGK